ncbi:MAG: phosphoribosylformylglycinamidine cyclo-ligase [Legionellales bacterium]|nr:phosphoribosylformylglycinamidine cyclo-ligase [Legionellales bacterium]
MNSIHGVSGVDNILGDICSKKAYQLAESTLIKSDYTDKTLMKDLKGAFANIFLLDNNKIAIASDGIGTKIDIAERVQKYDTLGFDLAAMIVDDIICVGAKPIAISNILDADYLDISIIEKLMQGLVKAALYTNIIISGGEIAELGSRISGSGHRMHFNWCATGIGVINDKYPLINNTKIQPGDIILSLKSQGFRSNGFTLVRNILSSRYGYKWHDYLFDKNTTYGDVLLKPSLIYAPFIEKLILNNIDIHGITHVTGGGIASNLARLLKKYKCGAILNELFEPHPEMLSIQEIGSVSDEIAYSNWNMGNGMLLIMKCEEAEKVIEIAENEVNYFAKVAGYITKHSYIDVFSQGNSPTCIRTKL